MCDVKLSVSLKIVYELFLKNKNITNEEGK